jgi:hypothetical protein
MAPENWMNLRRLTSSETCALLNSTSLGEVITEKRLRAHRTRAGLRVASKENTKRIDISRYIAWLAAERHAPPQVTRGRLSAADVAAKVGVSERAIQKWANEGCPHTTAAYKGGGSPPMLFVLAEVEAWMRANGRDQFSRSSRPAAQIDVAKHLTVDADAPLSEQIEGFARAAMAAARQAPIAVGELQKIAQTLKACAQEARAAEEARSKSEARSARFIERGIAERMLVSEARMFTSDLETLAAELPRRLMLSMEQEQIKPGDTEGIQRLLSKLVRQQVDVMREHRADSIERALAGAVEEAAA